MLFNLQCYSQAALTDEQKAKVQAISTLCREQSGVNEELILKARRGEYTDDEKLKEHLFCFSKKLGFQNEAGVVQPAVINAKLSGYIPADVLKRATDKCEGLTADTPQQTAFDVLKCFSVESGARISFS